MEKKTITINPALFKIGKTKKQKKQKPLVSPKMIKRTLINRIKDRRKKVPPAKTANVEVETKEEDDFKKSESFLAKILEKRKNAPEIVKAKNVTVKTHNPLNNYHIEPIQKNVENIIFKPNENLNYSIDNEVQYGCMKNGVKPCFRSCKNNKVFINKRNFKEVSKPYNEEEEVKNIVASEINKAINGKTEYSTDLIEKFQGGDKPLQILEDVKLDSIVDISNEIQDLNIKPEISENVLNIETLEIAKPESAKPESELIINVKPEETEDAVFEIKKTIKRKYTLGKDDKRQVGVLAKNKRTKKNILDYIKEFKKMTHEESKKYLQNHGLMKIGSVAPYEVVRKLCENTMLAGDIINTDNDILLHNLINNGE